MLHTLVYEKKAGVYHSALNQSTLVYYKSIFLFLFSFRKREVMMLPANTLTQASPDCMQQMLTIYIQEVRQGRLCLN